MTRVNFSLNINYIAWASWLTQQTALAVWPYVGQGEPHRCDAVAVATMRRLLNQLPTSFRVVAGEGERDNAPMIMAGEILGDRSMMSPTLNLAIDPLEGTEAAAAALPGACSVIAIAPEGHLLTTPDVYMEKLAISPGEIPKELNLNMPLPQLCQGLAKVRGLSVTDLHIGILQRPRHAEVIQQLRQLGCHIHLISDGDVFGIIKTIRGEWHLYCGSGGAPEGVLAAAALGNSGGWMQGRLVLSTPTLQARAKIHGITDFSKIYTLTDIARQPTLFCATAITRCDFLQGLTKLPRDTSKTKGLLSDTLILWQGHHHRIQTYHPLEQPFQPLDACALPGLQLPCA